MNRFRRARSTCVLAVCAVLSLSLSLPPPFPGDMVGGGAGAPARPSPGAMHISRPPEVSAGTFNITEYPVGNNPDTLASDPQGNIWFSMWGQQIGVHYASNDTVQLISVPTSGTPDGLAVDERGDVWVGIYTTRELAVYHPGNGTWEKWVASSASSAAIPIVDGSRDTVWMTDHPGNNIIEFDRTTHAFTYHSIPTPDVWAVDPEVDADGDVWFTAWKADAIIELNRTTGQFTTYTTPTAGSGPAFCQFDPGKTTLYFSEWNGNRIGALDILSGNMIEWPVSMGRPSGMGYDPNGYVWYALNDLDAIGILFPNNGTYIEEALPARAGMKDGGFVDQNHPGVFWFTETGAAKIGKAEFSGKGGAVITRIDVTPSTVNMTADATQQFTAIAYDQAGNRVNTSFTWSATGGTVSRTGLYTPDRVGTFLVYANASGESGSAVVDVTHGASVRVDITPSNVSVSADMTLRFSAEGEDSHGNRWVLASPVWRVVGGSGAGSIDATGLYTPDRVGNWSVEAMDPASGVHGSTGVTVTPGAAVRVTVSPPTASIKADETLMFTADARDIRDNPLPGGFIWGATGGNISPSGLYTPDRVGTFTVYANRSGVSGQAVVSVSPGRLARIGVSPSTAVITADDTLRFTAAGFDSKGNSVPVQVTWSVENGVIDPAGTFIPERTGVWEVRATRGAITGVASVRVDPGALAVAVLTPSRVSLSVGENASFALSLQDANSNTVHPDKVVWRMSGDGTGIFDETTRTFTGRSPGSTTLTAEVSAGNITRSVSAEITVWGSGIGAGSGWVTYLFLVVGLVAAAVVLGILLWRRRRRPPQAWYPYQQYYPADVQEPHVIPPGTGG